MLYAVHKSSAANSYMCVIKKKMKTEERRRLRKTSAILSAIDDDYSVEKNMKRKESELPKRYRWKGRNGIGDDVMMGENIFFSVVIIFIFFFALLLHS